MYDWKSGGFGLYLHWPFCESKCPYCDFNSHVAQNIDQDQWLRAYINQMQAYGEVTKGRVLQSIYFGGGTPSLMKPAVVAGIIETATSIWPTVNDLEITLEANPGSVDVDKFIGFRGAGVNRVSIGVQALDDNSLKALGRKHSAAEAIKAVEAACRTFDRYSFDLIYARQNQGLENWERELRLAISLAGDHLSLYQLTIEQGTAFGARAAAGGLKGLPDEDLSADLYDATQEICEQEGFPAYEISNHAREGSESRHNLIYWRAGDYIGIGPGAHGRITDMHGRWATEEIKNPTIWLQNCDNHGARKTTALTQDDCALEYLLMALRTREGLSLARYTTMAGRPLSQTRIASLIALGLLVQNQDQISATRNGRMVLNGILRELAAD